MEEVFTSFCVARVCQHQLGFLVDLRLDLDRTLAQRKAQRQAKSKVRVTQYICMSVTHNDHFWLWLCVNYRQ